MSQEKKELLISYMKVNIAPILVDFISSKDIPEATTIKANCPIQELNGHYEKENYIAPNWYNELMNKEEKILIIEDIDSIPLNEQQKFIEILKYKQISTFFLPDNCIILVTAKNISKETINEEIYSLVAPI